MIKKICHSDQLMQTIQFGTQKLEKTDKDLADAYVRLVNNVVDMGDEEVEDLDFSSRN